MRSLTMRKKLGNSHTKIWSSRTQWNKKCNNEYQHQTSARRINEIEDENFETIHLEQNK